MATLTHHLLSEANSPKPAGFEKTRRPSWGAGRRLRPEPGSCPARWGHRPRGRWLGHRGPPRHHAPGLRGVTTVCSRPERRWEPGVGRRGTGVGGQAAPPPASQCPPLSGPSWPPLPLGEQALFSFPATDGAGGWWVLGEGARASEQGGNLPWPHRPLSLGALLA